MLPDLPGWNSLPAVTRYHNWAEALGIAFLGLLVVAEIVGYQYSHRKDHLTDQHQIATNQRHEEEMARLHLETAKVKERAAELEKAAADAKLELARISTPRVTLLTEESTSSIIEKLKPFAGTKFDTGTAINSGEQADFLYALRPILQKAGWILLPWDGPGPLLSFGESGLPVSGSVAAQNVEVHLHPIHRDRLLPAAEALISALKGAGIEAKYWGFNVSSRNDDAMHILTGDKR
jgi:hypothetical protein